MLVFMLFVVVSVATLVYPVVNYLYFYRCIENLRLSFSDFTLTFYDNRVNFTCVLIVSNVEPYSGVRLRDLRYTFSFFDVDGKLVDLYGGEVWFEKVPLNPCSNLTVPISECVVGDVVLNALREAAVDGVVHLRIRGDALLFAFIGEFWISFEPWDAEVNV